jgi:nucleoside-diphosphate-sugar epimerase
MTLDKSKPILVTGCAGFIGARTTEMLLDQGYTVVGIDNFNDYYDQRLKLYRLCRIHGQESRFAEKFPEIPSTALNTAQWIETLLPESTRRGSFTFHLTDIENQPEVDGLIAQVKPSAIINLAARAGVRASLENPQLYVGTNVMGCLNLLEACRRHGVKKFVLASTSSLYADQPMPFHEDLPVNTPISPYAATKKSAEMLCYTWHYLHDLNVTVLRYFTVYGPAGRPDMSILRFIRWIDLGTPITIYGDGQQSRDFTYIDDIASGTVSSLKLTGHQTINLGGGGEPVSLMQVIATLEELLGKKALVHNEPFQKSDIPHTSASNKRAAEFLRWRASWQIDKGLQNSVEWYLENQQWCRYIIL